MDSDLRNGLWSAIDIAVWSHRGPHCNLGLKWVAAPIRDILQTAWISFLKQPLDKQSQKDGGLAELRAHFFGKPWNEAYDFIEFMLEHAMLFQAALVQECNAVLERENAGYRIIGQEITPITNTAEMETVETAFHSGLAGVDIHIKRAVELLSDRKAPDYRNAIKEAVSAVESACRVVSKDEKATLGQALTRISDENAIHPALKKAFSALYGYTSDKGGIRHSLLEESTVTFTDAKFMVIACSAFVNYLAGKVAGLSLEI